MGTLKQIGVHIALVAMLLRALVPAGWMPDTSGLHRAPLMLCDGSGPMSAMEMGTNGPANKKQDQGDTRSSDTCPYFAASHSATTPAPLADILPAARYESAAAIPIISHFAQAQRYEPHAARAPPSLRPVT